MKKKRGEEEGLAKGERKIWTGRWKRRTKNSIVDIFTVFSSVLRIRSRDRARNDITALYELHLRNGGMPYEPAQVFLF